MLCNVCILTLTFFLLANSLCELKSVMNFGTMCHGCMLQWIVNFLILLVELNSVACILMYEINFSYFAFELYEKSISYFKQIYNYEHCNAI